MKLFTLIILSLSLQVSANHTYGQEVTLKYRNAEFEVVLRDLATQAGYYTTFRSDWAKDIKPVTISVERINAFKALDLLLKDQPFTYKVSGKIIYLTPQNAPPQIIYMPSDTGKRVISGIVRSEDGKTIPGVTVREKGVDNFTATDGDGRFTIEVVKPRSIIVFSSINLETTEYMSGAVSREFAEVTMKMRIADLQEVVVNLNTGFQKVPAERATGSFFGVGKKLITRTPTTNLLDRLDGIVPGMIFKKTNQVNANDPPISIRGRGTIFADPNPLIILNNFPYDGDLSNINPNDIESFTILRDAAAASIWGARSGNGVIVITTKSGAKDQPPRLSFNSSITVGNKPDLYHQQQLSSAEYIEVEKFLFSKGHYDNFINFNPEYPLSPVVETLADLRQGKISQATADKRLAELSNHDVRDDLTKYFYRRSVNQQYSANVSGGGKNSTYYFGTGYDRNRPSNVGSSFERVTLTLNNTYKLSDRFDLTTGVFLVQTKTTNNSQNYLPKTPYESIAGPNGEALSVVKDYSRRYVDSMSQYVLDWRYRPLDERSANGKVLNSDSRVDIGMKYKILNPLSISVNYQYARGVLDGENLNTINSYFTRDYINRYSSIDQITGGVSRAIPLGDILTRSNAIYRVHYGRAQFGYDNVFNESHTINAILGIELRDYNNRSKGDQLFGYDQSTSTDKMVDYYTVFPQLPFGFNRIPRNSGQLESNDRFRSYFFNATYSYTNRYFLSASARKDESNLFGVKANQKGISLWSVGAKWIVTNEHFFKSRIISNLVARFTYGYTGNVDRTLSAFTTAKLLGSVNSWGVNTATIINPPNPSLRWERVRMINYALEFGLLNDRIRANAEYYDKLGLDIIGNSPTAPQTGINQYRGNTANIRTKGFDVTLSADIFRGSVAWTTSFLLSVARDRVTNYKVTQGSTQNYITNNFGNPLVGKPYSSVFSYQFLGLDTLGNPVGALDGKPSIKYGDILSSKDFNSLIFHGTYNPLKWGSWMNIVRVYNFEFSANILYRFDYYFRKPNLNYSSLIAGNFRMPDYEGRWKNPGDESNTSIPSFIFPVNSQRDNFYRYSEAVVEKGDNIRLQDLTLSYQFVHLLKRNKSFSDLKAYFVASNLGILWRSNRVGIDPESPSGPMPKAYTLGMNFTY